MVEHPHGVPDIEGCFFGAATIGERGQVVIPAAARTALDLHPGDKLLVFRHPLAPGMLILARVNEMQGIVQHITTALDVAGRSVTDALASDHD